MCYYNILAQLSKLNVLVSLVCNRENLHVSLLERKVRSFFVQFITLVVLFISVYTLYQVVIRTKQMTTIEDIFYTKSILLM